MSNIAHVAMTRIVQHTVLTQIMTNNHKNINGNSCFAVSNKGLEIHCANCGEFLGLIQRGNRIMWDMVSLCHDCAAWSQQRVMIADSIIKSGVIVDTVIGKVVIGKN